MTSWYWRGNRNYAGGIERLCCHSNNSCYVGTSLVLSSLLLWLLLLQSLSLIRIQKLATMSEEHMLEVGHWSLSILSLFPVYVSWNSSTGSFYVKLLTDRKTDKRQIIQPRWRKWYNAARVWSKIAPVGERDVLRVQMWYQWKPVSICLKYITIIYVSRLYDTAFKDFNFLNTFWH